MAKDGIQSITQRDDTGAFVKDEKGDIDHRQYDDIILTTKNKDTGETETTSNTVTITAEDGNTANVTLKDVHIETEGSWNNTGSAPIEIKGDGDTNLELNGDNTVLSGDSHHAAIEKADKNGTGTLTIKDDLNDNGSVKDKDENGNAAGGDTGKLLAGGYGDGAGIGGGYNSITDLSYADTSNITIKGGEITAAAVVRMVRASAAAPTVKQKTSALKAMLTSRQAEMAVQALAAVSKETMSLLLETPLSML